MSYRVAYNSVKIKSKNGNPKRTKAWILAAACVLGLIVGIQISGAGETVKDFLLPGDSEVTETALINMVDNLRAGESLGDAVFAFCQEIIGNALENR